MPFVNYANKDVNWPTLNVPLSKQDYNECRAAASGHKTVPLSRSTDDMCSHKLCTWSLLNLTVTSSNGRSQVKPQITKIRQRKPFWDADRMSAAALLPTVTRLTLLLLVLRFYENLCLTFKSVKLLALSHIIKCIAMGSFLRSYSVLAICVFSTCFTANLSAGKWPVPTYLCYKDF